MSDLVTAFPLPPNYYLQRLRDSGEEIQDDAIAAKIRNMEPPAPPADKLVCFGVQLKEAGQAVHIVERMISEGTDPSFVIPPTLEERIILLRELKNSLLLNFLQMAGLVVGSGKDEAQQQQSQLKACINNLDRCQRHAMYVLAELRKQQGLLELRNELFRLINE